MRPTFVLSIDAELIWGSFDHTPPDRFAARYPDLRGTIALLLRTLEDFEVPATWALVGHLFLRSCERAPDGTAHPDLARPDFAWYPGDWFAQDPCTDRTRHPLWYGDDIVERVQGSRVAQEIGSHSFSHIPYGDPGCSEAAAATDLAACLGLAKARGLALRSFVFPRNTEGHHRLLKDNGFVAYRGRDDTWFESFPGRLKRVGHLVDQAARVTPPVTEPTETLPGLWNIPGCMMLMGRDGVRRGVPLGARIAKGRAGLARAVQEGRLFHLWLHPSNLAADREGMIGALRAIVGEAARLRDSGALDIRTMGALADELVTTPPAAGTPRE